MIDAIANFVIYLRECIEDSEDPDEVSRLESVLEKAERIKAQIEHTTAQQVGV